MDIQELLALIEQATVENWTHLDLSGQNLTEVPSEIGQLHSLKWLNLGGNQLVDVPPEIGQLSNLLVLDLYENQLANFPLEIGWLSKLTILDLSSNELKDVPQEIGELRSLIELDLSENQLTSLPTEIGKLDNLSQLTLNSNLLEDLSLEFYQLTSLTELSVTENQLRILPAEFGLLTNLINLNLRMNELTAMPPEIGKLTNLTELRLDENELTAVPPEIGNLTNLTELNLYNNQLMAIPPEIGNLSNLTLLNLSRNKLTAVPPEIGNLFSLRELSLRDNQLTAVPSEIGKLSKLITLDLWNNQLAAIPPEIGNLTHLTKFGLSSNALTALPPQIGDLANLIELYLSYNQLTAVPPQIGQLSHLTHIWLRDNELTHLSNSFQQLTQLKHLDLRENPALGISPEVLEQRKSPSLILQTYFSARCPLHEAKMLLVGQGGVGKTALARRLIHNLPPDENQGKTEGVDIFKYQITSDASASPITLNLWDFGGQGVYQATHQFFFTSRSLYLIVVNARTGEHESRLNHWLNLVVSLSDNSPTIIVVNQQDLHPLQLDERALKDKYRNLLAVIPTSCTSGSGIPQLHQAIDQALAHLPHVNDPFPIQWLELKKRLETMETNYISFERFAEYCLEAGIIDWRDQRSWGRVLHQLGVILNYQDDNYRQLESTHVLKPEWVTDGVYRILSDPDGQIASNNGVLTSDMLDAILDPDQYPRPQQAFIVGMMQKFELSFPLPNRPSHHLIPDLLPKNQPEAIEGFQQADLLHFQIHYAEFLPASIISRFMVGMMAALDRSASWRSGAVLQFDGNPALVRADLEARKIYISVAGPKATRRSLLHAIRMQLHAVHVTFPKLPRTEHIPIPGGNGKTVAYHALLNLEAKGIETYYDPFNDVTLDVKKLLDGIETPNQRREWRLYEQLIDGYNLEELRELCFQHQVNYEDLPDKKSAFARELVLHMGRHGRLDELADALRR